MTRIAYSRGHMAKADNIPANEQKLLEQFIDNLWMEHGLTENTLSAYRNDLAGFSSWLIANNNCLESVSTSDVQHYLASKFEQGYKSRSSARLSDRTCLTVSLPM